METEQSNSSFGYAHAPSYLEISSYRVESTVSTEHADGFRVFCLGTEDVLMAQALKTMMDQGLLAIRDCCAARRDTRYHARRRWVARS